VKYRYVDCAGTTQIVNKLVGGSGSDTHCARTIPAPYFMECDSPISCSVTNLNTPC
jgi:hypothetical protein